jgi:hypothetical protein
MFNKGNLAELDRLFARADFEWYSTDAPGERVNEAAYDRSTLVRYFADRHGRGEHIKLRSFRFAGNSGTGGTKPYGNFVYQLSRSATDLAATAYHGKGAARCYGDGVDVIFVWSMARER